jgi:hypothetical protein
MPCIDIPRVPSLPTLPTTLSITPPALPRPPTSFLCCNLPPLPPAVAAMIAKYESGASIPLPPLPPSLQVVVDAIDDERIAINSFLDSLPLNCPRAMQQALTGGS